MGRCFFEAVIFLVCRYPFKLPDSTGRSDDSEATRRSTLTAARRIDSHGFTRSAGIGTAAFALALAPMAQSHSRTRTRSAGKVAKCSFGGMVGRSERSERSEPSHGLAFLRHKCRCKPDNFFKTKPATVGVQRV